MPSPKKSTKASCQLPFGSYEWALARFRENPKDKFAATIILKHDPENAEAEKVVLEVVLEHDLEKKAPVCFNTGKAVDCKGRPDKPTRCDLCLRVGRP